MTAPAIPVPAVPVQVRRLPHGEGLALPAYATEGAAGLDLLAAVAAAVTIAPAARALIPTGLALRHGIMVANSPGTIDSDYRGELQVILLNAGAEAFIVERGMRIAQAVLAPVVQLAWQEVATLDPTTRDAGGFGSTGTHSTPGAGA